MKMRHLNVLPVHILVNIVYHKQYVYLVQQQILEIYLLMIIHFVVVKMDILMIVLHPLVKCVRFNV